MPTQFQFYQFEKSAIHKYKIWLAFELLMESLELCWKQAATYGADDDLSNLWRNKTWAESGICYTDINQLSQMRPLGLKERYIRHETLYYFQNECPAG